MFKKNCLKSFFILFYLDSTDRFIDTDPENVSKKLNGGVTICLRQANQRSNNRNRKRVIKMLFVVVFEYFICWTPLYILDTWKTIDYIYIHYQVSDMAWSLVLLLSYTSSCIHPVTYCFMNKNFRKAFLGVFRCCSVGTNTVSRSCTEVSHFNSTTSPTGKNKTRNGLLSREYTY